MLFSPNAGHGSKCVSDITWVASRLRMLGSIRALLCRLYNEELNGPSTDSYSLVRHHTKTEIRPHSSTSLKRMSKNHDQQTLLNAIEHIIYELQMIVELVSIEKRYPYHVQFAILESWLIHLRGFNDMLGVRKKHDDILISDYVPHSIQEFIDVDMRMRINKELAHVTSKRKEFGPPKFWDCAAIYCQAWPRIAKAAALLETWVGEHESGSRWHQELIATRVRGADVFERYMSTNNDAAENESGQKHMAQPAVTYTVGYLPREESSSDVTSDSFR
jgi:hypothetical protein